MLLAFFFLRLRKWHGLWTALQNAWFWQRWHVISQDCCDWTKTYYRVQSFLTLQNQTGIIYASTTQKKKDREEWGQQKKLGKSCLHWARWNIFKVLGYYLNRANFWFMAKGTDLFIKAREAAFTVIKSKVYEIYKIKNIISVHSSLMNNIVTWIKL